MSNLYIKTLSEKPFDVQEDFSTNLSVVAYEPHILIELIRYGFGAIPEFGMRKGYRDIFGHSCLAEEIQ